MKPITYTSDSHPQDYAKAIFNASNVGEVQAVTFEYRTCAEDAHRVAMSMNDDDWEIFRKGLLLERSGKYAGDAWSEKFGSILLPEVMFMASVLASEYGVPWGTAFIRLKEGK